VNVLAKGGVPFPPSVGDFYLPSLVHGAGPWLTKFTLLIWITVAIVILFFLLAYRRPKLVPTRMQWLAESIYGFTRNGVARDVIGPEGLRFAPYLTCLFLFILVANVFGIVPPFQISPNAHIAFPVTLAAMSYILFLYQGIRRHGLVRYLKAAVILPGVPWVIQPLLIPIEALQTFVVRPFTLALRLFANMFAGHMMLLVFTLGGFVLLNVNNPLVKPISVLSWVLAIGLTFFELLVAVLQAYVFTILTASYVESSLAEEH
jgi:F-type H+-transporting ATPase subunit a